MQAYLRVKWILILTDRGILEYILSLILVCGFGLIQYTDPNWDISKLFSQLSIYPGIDQLINGSLNHHALKCGEMLIMQGHY